MHFHYRVTFTGYILCFGATTYLVTLTFDLLTLRVFCVQCFSCPTHIPIPIILRLSVTELRLVNFFEIPDPDLPIRLLTFTALRRRLSHVIGKNSIFPLWRLQSLLHMRSITWPVHRRSPKTTRKNFLTPNCLFSICRRSEQFCWLHITRSHGSARVF